MGRSLLILCMNGRERMKQQDGKHTQGGFVCTVLHSEDTENQIGSIVRFRWIGDDTVRQKQNTG